MHEIILNIRYFGRGLSKSLEKLTLIVHSNPDPFIKNKRGMELVTSPTSGYEKNTQKFLN